MRLPRRRRRDCDVVLAWEISCAERGQDHFSRRSFSRVTIADLGRCTGCKRCACGVQERTLSDEDPSAFSDPPLPFTSSNLAILVHTSSVGRPIYDPPAPRHLRNFFFPANLRCWKRRYGFLMRSMNGFDLVSSSCRHINPLCSEHISHLPAPKARSSSIIVPAWSKIYFRFVCRPVDS